MDRPSNRVIVIGAGPVGLCLSLALAQQGIPVCLIEALGDDNFLEQVPRAGTNHPATLELFDAHRALRKLEPRGIIAPLFHYWDRHEGKLIAEFDHAHLKDDTPLPLRAAMRAHQDRRGSAEAGQGASRDRAAAVDRVHGFSAGRRRRHRHGRRIRRARSEAIARQLSRQRRRRAQHRAQGSRHRVRGLHLPRPHA